MGFELRDEPTASTAARGGVERDIGSGVVIGGVFWIEPLELHDDGSLPDGGRA